MKIYLSAREDDLFRAWKLHCAEYDFVTVTKQDIMIIDAEAIVSPANSFGFMTGGIDLHYKNYFGQYIEDDLRTKINLEFNADLCVGQATSVKVFNPPPTIKYKYMIAAPTMRMPECVAHTINSFLAAKAALIEANKLKVESIVFPGLGTGTGGMLPEDCAKQVRAAIKYVLMDGIPYGGPGSLYEEQTFIRHNVVSERWFKVQHDGGI